ncbi:MAG TPA: hypothetical protein VKS79_24075 [Gemmataceae bacterium]|nr:hypothetical protein [Gemmataceae bacterium]
MRWYYPFLPFLALLVLGCEKTPDSKITTAPKTTASESPPIPDFSSPSTGKTN